MVIDRVVKQRNRLDNYCTEWCALENEKQQYFRRAYLNKDFSSGTIQTLYMMQDRIDYLVFQIVKKVDWFHNTDNDFDNEVATYIYNEYASGLHRGITVLMHHFADR